MLGIILGILMFMALVILHELGHFRAAKKSGVKVKEFGIGIPPKVCTLWTDKSGTEYTLNRIPLGGFVSLKGEDGTDSEVNDADTFHNAKLYQKLMIIVAGVVMNLLTAFVIFTSIFTIGVKPISIIPNEIDGIKPETFLTPSVEFLEQEGLLQDKEQYADLLVEYVASGSLAEQMGLGIGDQILTLNDLPVDQLTLRNILAKHTTATGNTLLALTPDQKEKNLTFDCEAECVLGIAYQSPDITIKYPLPQAMIAALKEIKGEWNMTMSALGNIGKKLFSTQEGESKEALKQLTGPVGAIKFGEKLLDYNGVLVFLGFGAMISLALAFFNILPIPALDGGRFRTTILQHLCGAKAETFSKIEGRINVIFFRLLMGLGILILLKDLVIWRGLKIPFLG